MDQLIRVREIAERIAGGEGMELVDVEFVGRGPNAVLRIYLDKPGGITLGDCERISGQVGAVLDVEDFIPTRYTLEVSSPGLDRRLVKLADFERFAGRQVKLVLKAPRAGRRRFRGKLRGVQVGTIQLEQENGQGIGFEYAEIQKANLVVEW
ncbi:MAG: ribosome maturation factor RimP [Terriglobia bacterium]